MRGRISLLPALLVTLVPLAACDSPAAPEATEAHAAITRANGRIDAEGVAVEIPFRLEGYSILESMVIDPECGAYPPNFRNNQVGGGQVAHLGRVRLTFTFCNDATDVLDDGLLTEGESVPYWDGLGFMTAANGDELYLLIANGSVLPSTDPDYKFQFQDPFVFIGGTGRFAGAEGSGMTDSYVSFTDDLTEHSFSGTLILKPGR